MNKTKLIIHERFNGKRFLEDVFLSAVSIRILPVATGQFIGYNEGKRTILYSYMKQKRK